MKKILVSTLAALSLSTAVMASPNSQTGCGLGALLIKDNSTAFMLALQASTNSIFFNQTFAISSGTLGCKKTSLVMNERAQEFVASNMDILSKEVAIGHGESLDTLAELLNIEDKAAFSASLQANYNRIYPTQDVEMSDVLENITSV